MATLYTLKDFLPLMWLHMYTNCSIFTAPTAPLNLVTTDTTAFTVSLDWEEPAEPNGIIDNYIIRYYETSSPENVTLYNDSIQSTNAVVNNLNAFTNYTFRVSAVTVEEGPFEEVSATTNQSSM